VPESVHISVIGIMLPSPPNLSTHTGNEPKQNSPRNLPFSQGTLLGATTYQTWKTWRISPLQLLGKSGRDSDDFSPISAILKPSCLSSTDKPKNKDPRSWRATSSRNHRYLFLQFRLQLVLDFASVFAVSSRSARISRH
jgi:hypothetical protein